MSFNEYLVVLLAFLAELLGTASGVSASSVFVPMAGLFEPYHTVLAITSLLHIFGNSFRLIIFRKHFNWNIALWFGGFSIFGAGVGAIFSSEITEQISKLILGFLLIFISIYFLRNNNSTLFKTKKSAYVGGFLSGLFTGLLGTGGAIRAIALVPFGLTPQAFIATSTLIDCLGDYLRFGIYLKKGFLTADHLFYLGPLAGAAWFGSVLGQKLLTQINTQKFKKIVLYIVLSMGLLSLIQAFL